MSVTYLDVKIANLIDPQRSKKVQFLVDSGAVYSVVPEKDLKQLGITDTDTERFTLANGEVIEKAVGNALFEFQGKKRSSPVVFGAKDVYLLGAVTLESLGVILDPINRQLRPLPMLMM
ncbi:TPA: aspartyl protease [Patescibacteria group bacterium]|uniref:Peptidase A2 domain-containing protein n=1 Tax=Candidatus Gottesmanbacteria bacterium GW2011_GWA1_43_11 TaxID=1618436 RepID=A0A0G1CGX7_9BACT|nr:MAG: hypothetical protein UV59_C0014G0020 [Candidatus Gottesmanbacteria bacterium GW2011_GWA1_43_11]HCS79501.1 aspartyl protease [Patescibacteria group bacterium]